MLSHTCNRCWAITCTVILLILSAAQVAVGCKCSKFQLRVENFFDGVVSLVMHFFQNIDLSSLQLALTEKNSQLPDLSCCGLPAVLADADPDAR